ncbi:MAG: energy-coupled thiamine transporter ThiT [Defluviitaleaceae bacterium]|nr:energy-coupled thiamine transporter ThiT [Defluviitaleaceae bacterium]
MSQAKKITVAAVCVAMAFMLNQVALFRMPMGGSITPASMLFIALAGYWLGPVYGVLSGVAMGLLDTATGAVAVHPMQYLLDYIFGFGALGLAGFFRKWRHGLQIGFVAGVAGRFLMVFLSGYIFFYMWAPEGQHAAVYSLIYNATYIVPELVVSLVIISLPSMRHAIDVVTKQVVPPDVYAAMTRNRGSISAKARLISGGVIGALGGMAFVVVSYISRLENLAIMYQATGAELFQEAPSRVYRIIERNTEHIFALQSVGVVFLAIAAMLLFSSMIIANEEKGTSKIE